MTQSVNPGRTSAYSQRTIGLLADWFDEQYQLTILRTAQEAVVQRGSNLLAFAGGIPGSTKRCSDRRKRAFEMIDPRNVEGAILLAGTMVNELGSDALEQLLRQLEGLPLCAIGIEVPGIPSILVDNQAGIDQAMNHLVERHQAKRVAFIRGPHLNKEAESRFTAYRSALERSNISYDDSLVFQGDFLQESGKQAVAHWLDASVKLDAIIAANDEMALGALRQLNQRGKSVPGDVALVGFDDLHGAASTTPPLTTVRQPLKDLAVAAVRTIMDQILGRQAPRLQVMQTHLVVRESCGCSLRLSSTGQGLNPPDSSRSPKQHTDFASAFAQRTQSLKAELQRAARGDFQMLGAWDDSLISTFPKHVMGDESTFVEQLEQFVATIVNAGGDVSRFHDVVTAFRRYAIPCCSSDAELRASAEDLLQEARMAVASAVERHEARKRMALEHFSQKLLSIGAELAGSFDLSRLDQVVRERLPKLGVTACYVAVYEPFRMEQRGEPTAARLVAAYDAECEVTLSATPFDVRALAPAEWWPPARGHRFMVLPLFWNGVDLGFTLLECDDPTGMLLENVREQLSIGLYGALLARGS